MFEKIFKILFLLFTIITFSFFFYNTKFYIILILLTIPFFCFLSIVLVLRYFFNNDIKKFFQTKNREFKISFSFLILLFFAFSVSIVATQYIIFGILEGNDNDIIIRLWKIIYHIILTLTLIILFVTGVYGLGKTVLHLIKIPLLDDMWDFILSFGCGAALISYGIFGLGFLNLYYRPVFIVIFLASYILSLKNIIPFFKKSLKKTIVLSFVDTHQKMRSIMLFFIFFLFVVLFIYNFQERPGGFDALHTYFNVPQLFLKYHKYTIIKNFAASNMGQVAEMIYLFVLGLFGIEFVSFIPVIFLSLSTILIYKIAEEIFSKTVAGYAAIVFIFTPNIPIFSMELKTETVAIFFFLLAVAYLLHYYKNNRYISLLILSALFGGVSVGVKYNNLIYFGLIVFFYFFYHTLYERWKGQHKQWKQQLHLILIFIFFFFIGFAPWLIKNIYYFSQPLYPYSIFGEKKYICHQQIIRPDNDERKWFAQQRGEEATRILYTYKISDNPFLNSIWSIWNISVNQEKIGNVFRTSISPIFLITTLFFIFRHKKNVFIIFSIITFSSAVVIWLFIGIQRIWYLTPMLSVYSVIVGYFIYQVRNFKLIHCILSIGLSLLIIFTFFLILSSRSFYKSSFYITDIHVVEMDIDSLYNVSQYINQEILAKNPTAYILSYPDPRSAYIERNDRTVLNDFWGCYFGLLIREEKDPARVRTKLIQQGFTHILFSKTIFDNYKLNHSSVNDHNSNQSDPNYNSIFSDLEFFYTFRDLYLKQEYCTRLPGETECDDTFYVYKIL